MSVLSDYLTAHIPPTWRKTDVVEALHGVVDRATDYKYLAGTHPRNPPESILQAFADALPGASVMELRAAVRVPVGIDTPWIPIAEANRLNAGQRQALDMFIKATVESASGDDDGADELTGDVPGAAGQQRATAPPDSDQLAAIMTEVARLRTLGRDDLADAVLQRLSATAGREVGSTGPPQPR